MGAFKEEAINQEEDYIDEAYDRMRDEKAEAQFEEEQEGCPDEMMEAEE